MRQCCIVASYTRVALEHLISVKLAENDRLLAVVFVLLFGFLCKDNNNKKKRCLVCSVWTYSYDVEACGGYISFGPAELNTVLTCFFC